MTAGVIPAVAGLLGWGVVSAVVLLLLSAPSRSLEREASAQQSFANRRSMLPRLQYLHTAPVARQLPSHIDRRSLHYHTESFARVSPLGQMHMHQCVCVNLSLIFNRLLSLNCELLTLDFVELVLFGRSVTCHRSELGIQLRRGLRCKLVMLQHGDIFLNLSVAAATVPREGFAGAS